VVDYRCKIDYFAELMAASVDNKVEKMEEVETEEVSV
jgi:hypothetical protein